jgi:hypothetical protein
MALFLQIIGGLFLLFILLLVGGFLYVRYKFRKFTEAIGDVMPQPTTINLRPIEEDVWSRPSVATAVADFQLLGYERGQAYRPDEMPMLIVLPLVNRAMNAYGVVYDLNDGSIVWSDVVQRYEDGAVTVSNSTHAKGLKQRPNYENIYLPGQPVADLHRHLIEMRTERMILPATHEGFKSEFEEAYASETAWRDSQGISEEELAAVIGNTNMTATEEQLALAREEIARQANERLAERLRAEFLRTTTLSAAEWEDVEDRLAFVHDKLSKEELVEIVEMAFEDEVDIEIPEGDARAAFAVCNTNLPPHNQFTLIGRLESPLEADVYAAPAEMYVQ